MSEADRAASRVRPLPTTMGAALDELEKDAVLVDSLGDLLARGYLGIRRSEDEAFRAQDEEFELRNHFYRF
jgi:glutamine synthetase